MHKLENNEIIHSGHRLILDLVAQIIELNGIQREDKPNRSILSSSIILSFSILEAYLNYISSLIIFEHKNNAFSPKILNRLSEVELDVLEEKKSTFDIKKIKVKKTDNSYIRIMDKLIVVPKLLAKTYSKDINIDKGCKNWEYLNELKEKRDDISHPKFDIEKIEQITDFRNMPSPLKPAYSIEPIVLLNGLISIRWYLRITGELLIDIYQGKFSSFNFDAIDILLSKLILDIDKKYSLHIKNLKTEINDNYKFSKNVDQKLIKTLEILSSKKDKHNK
jgi:hypothetical protein